MAWQGRIQAQVIAVVSFAIFGLLLLNHNGWLKFKPEKTYIRNALSFGVPLIPHALSGTIKTMVDRILISSMVGLSATGLYSVGFQIGMIIGILEDSFNKAYWPWLFERLKRNVDHEKRTIKLTYTYFVVIICCTIIRLIAPWFYPFCRTKICGFQ